MASKMQDPIEDTECNDLLRERGILPKKEPEVAEEALAEMIEEKQCSGAVAGDRIKLTPGLPIFKDISSNLIKIVSLESRPEDCHLLTFSELDEMTRKVIKKTLDCQVKEILDGDEQFPNEMELELRKLVKQDQMESVIVQQEKAGNNVNKETKRMTSRLSDLDLSQNSEKVAETSSDDVAKEKMMIICRKHLMV